MFGFQDTLWCLRITYHHFCDYIGDSEFALFFPGEHIGTRQRKVFEYFIKKFPELWSDVKTVTREAHKLERAHIDVDEWYENPALHKAVRCGSVDECRHILE